MAAYRRVHDMHVCVAVGLVGGVAAHHRVHDHACCHLHADCIQSRISSRPLRSTMSMRTFTFTFVQVCMTWALSCLKTVKQRARVMSEIESKLSDSRVNYNSMNDYRSQRPVFYQLHSYVNKGHTGLTSAQRTNEESEELYNETRQ